MTRGNMDVYSKVMSLFIPGKISKLAVYLSKPHPSQGEPGAGSQPNGDRPYGRPEEAENGALKQASRLEPDWKPLWRVSRVTCETGN
jgi:hypothetical protein